MSTNARVLRKMRLIEDGQLIINGIRWMTMMGENIDIDIDMAVYYVYVVFLKNLLKIFEFQLINK